MDFDEDISYESKKSFLEKRDLYHLKDKKLIGILARLHPVKGHEIFIKAAANILASNENIHFLITGNAEEMPALNNLIKQLGIGQNIHFIGFVDAPYDFLNVIDINVLTSYSESFPYVLLEGARLKKPTISSKVGGIPMLIEDGENGYLFKAGDSNELSKKLKVMLTDEAMSKAMGEALYKKDSDNYSLKKLALNHINIYNTMLENKKERNTNENN